MQTRFIPTVDRLVPLGLGVALATWMAIQVVGLGIASAAFEGPEDPQYYRNGLRYAQVLAAGQRQSRVSFQVPSAPRAGHPVTIGVQGASSVRLGRPATIREDRVLPVVAGQVTVRLPRGWWLVRAGDHEARFRVKP